MCTSCGYNPCNCNSTYSFNWYNTENYPCNPCSTTVVCKKKIPASCTFYKGANLTNINLTSNINIELILTTIDLVIGQIKNAAIIAADNQAIKNTNILIALNNINTRLNTLAGGTPHAPYVI